ncbi:hypothetical protein PR048_021310 [Dryococelus australis]|uniref:CCHC-type domain-containing protein n=1 Tax=Dryococelus australis TaxID=614101 RepID=A0ABQ9GXZ9_9NEOP|nr:hypothetical protein PR048_021310 [Dryococelus australis]
MIIGNLKEEFTVCVPSLGAEMKKEGRKFKRRRVTVNCYSCGKQGHVSKYCHNASKCFNCGKLGHHSKVCREPRKEVPPQERKSVDASGKFVNSEVLHVVFKAMSMKV